jgi:hypothetical protein
VLVVATAEPEAVTAEEMAEWEKGEPEEVTEGSEAVMAEQAAG